MNKISFEHLASRLSNKPEAIQEGFEGNELYVCGSSKLLMLPSNAGGAGSRICMSDLQCCLQRAKSDRYVQPRICMRRRHLPIGFLSALDAAASVHRYFLAVCYPEV
jgi:hypothetical protein